MAQAFKTAVFGLGSMGYGMAASCLRAGHQVWGFDIDPAAVERFRCDGGEDGDQPTDLNAVVVVVLNAAQTESVLFGEDGIVAELNPGTLVMSCATVSPDFAREMEARCAQHEVLYLDAPISGGAVKSAQGALTIMASGSPAAFSAARPVLDACADTVFELGSEAGPGSAMKAVNQLSATARARAGCWKTAHRISLMAITARKARSTSGPRIWALFWMQPHPQDLTRPSRKPH